MATKKEKTEVAIVDNSAEALISQAITNKVDVGTMERLLAMRTQMKAERAKEAFNRAMGLFQAECPTIVKTKEVFTRDGRSAYKYAPIESIVSQVKVPLERNGFNYTTQIDLTEKGVKATIKVTHVEGHSEETSMEVPLGSKTQIMSDSQVTAAASTFAKRYAFCNAFGILTGDEDNDGAKFDQSPIKDADVPTVSYDDHEAGSTPSKATSTSGLPPWKQKPQVITDENKKKREIKDLVDSIVLHPLDKTADAYSNWIFAQTGLLLESQNFDEIIVELQKTKNGEK